MAKGEIQFQCRGCGKQLREISMPNALWHEANCMRSRELDEKARRLQSMAEATPYHDSYSITEIAENLEQGGIVVMHKHKGRIIVYFGGKEFFGATLRQALDQLP